VSEKPAPRLRLARVTIQRSVFLDVGEYLTPVAVTPLVIEASRLDRIPDLLRAGLADQQQRLDQAHTDST
jgi:hypothetical protein